jgi:Uma2 family endonuclease
MSTVAYREAPDPGFRLNLVDLATRFGPMPAERIRMEPRPGTATENDLVAANERHQFLCELVGGTLVEKTVGLKESLLTSWLIQVLCEFVERHRLGVIFPPDGMMRLGPGLVRLPDISFISSVRLSGGNVLEAAMFEGGPDLAVEVISPGNTAREMDQKLADYFSSGVRLVWYVYPKKNEVHVFTSSEERTVLTSSDRLEGGDVLPGFSVELSKLFAPVL